MSPRVVHVSAPTRLHFGLLSFGSAGASTSQTGGAERQFGGVGAMIARPRIELRIARSAEYEASGPHAARVREFVRRWAGFEGLAAEPTCRIEVLEAPPQHVGLGLGTQLGLSVAAGLGALLDRAGRSPLDLAASVGRGRRSAVGTYGFAAGGLIVERGKLPGEPLAPLDFRADLPSQWRFVLVRPAGDEGLSGVAERRAFTQLPPVPPKVTADLCRELRERLLPALTEGDFQRFSESLYRFGRTAGNCFAARQGGPFNGPVLVRLVERIRELGVEGVGQSSWGPTLFALLPDQQQAESFARRLPAEADRPLSTTIAPPDNAGVVVKVEPDGP